MANMCIYWYILSIDPHDSDDDDFSDIDEASRNDNKALYNSSNGFTIDQCSNNSIMLADSVPGRSPKSVPLSPSLFPFVPPYLTFVSHDDKSAAMPIAIKKVLKWKLTTITPIVIRKIILNSGFRLLKRKYYLHLFGQFIRVLFDLLLLVLFGQKPTIGLACGVNI